MVETGKIHELTEAGANEFMKKPFDVDVLLAHICQLLDVESLPAK
jgi:DNA-binding response OmpR family regulator